MDIAAMSTVMASSSLKAKASLAVMDNVMGVMKQQGNQLMEMLQPSGTQAPHPTLGNVIDLQA